MGTKVNSLTRANSAIDSKSNKVFQFDVESHLDPVRGDTFVFEGNHALPEFVIQRVFWIKGVQEGVTRGNHTNTKTDEILVVVAGSLCVTVTDVEGDSRQFLLDTATKALYIEHGLFIRMSEFSEDCVLLVLANHKYNVSERIFNKPKSSSAD
jgi:dTDP-4-dehydrorhamnose 3,5-epimerase-like enzyme